MAMFSVMVVMSRTPDVTNKKTEYAAGEQVAVGFVTPDSACINSK